MLSFQQIHVEYLLSILHILKDIKYKSYAVPSEHMVFFGREDIGVEKKSGYDQRQTI